MLGGFVRTKVPKTFASAIGLRRMSTKGKKGAIFSSPLSQWNVTNFQYEEHPHPTTRLRLPGLSHESFDRDSNPKLTSIMTTSSVARIYALHKPLQHKSSTITNEISNGHHSTERTVVPPPTEDSHQEEEYFMDWPHLTDDLYTFMSSSEYVMSRALYDKSVAKWPMDMKFTLANVGNCSVAMVSDFYACSHDSQGSVVSSTSSPHQRNLLWSNTYQLVTVDKSTRKPTRLPDWYKEKYNGKGCLGKGLILRPFDRPAVTYVHPYTVQWTDTDNYKHTNFTTYIRWAVDSLHAAMLLKSTNGCDADPSRIPHSPRGALAAHERNMQIESAEKALPRITKVGVARGARKVQVTYLRECLEGENVDMHVWQEDGSEEELVCFSLVKNGEDVCQMKWWFFTDEEDEDREFPG